MKTLDFTADDLVPANKFLSLSFAEFATDKIESLTVLVDGTPASNVKMYNAGDNTSGALVSVFDMVTNHDIKPGQTLPVKINGKTASGKSFSGTDSINVVDPTNVLGNAGSKSGVSDVQDTASDVTDTVDSTGILGKPSSEKRQQQMY